MKKILGTLVILLVLTFTLTSCVSTDGLNEYKRELDDVKILVEELEDEVEALELALEELQSQIDDMTPINDLDWF